MLRQIERMKTSRKVTKFLYGGATLQICKSSNMEFEIWESRLPDAMIQWSFTESDSNTS